MSLIIRISKTSAVISFLLTMGLQENAVPNFALLVIYLYQFINDIVKNSSTIFWEGLIAIPLFAHLIIFLNSGNYKIVAASFLALFCSLIYVTGLIPNYQRIDFRFSALVLIFIISSLYTVIKTKKESE